MSVSTTLLIVWASAAVAVVMINIMSWRRDRKFALSLAEERRTLPTRLVVDASAPRVSFLIAAWNERRALPACLDSILALPYPAIEVVVCAGGGDGSYEIAQSYQSESQGRHVVVLEQHQGEGKQHALSRCFERCLGSLIYLTDADCLMDDVTFALCLGPLLIGSHDAVTGSFYYPLPDQMANAFVLGQMAVRAYSAAHTHIADKGLLGGNCAISRKALVEAGAFTPPVRSGTDYDLAKRLLANGVVIKYQRHALIRSEFPATIQAYVRQQARWIRNVVVHGLRYRVYPEVLANLMTSIIGLSMLLGPVVALVLMLWRGPWAAETIAVSGLWTVAFLQAVMARLRYLGFAGRWLGAIPIGAALWSPGHVCLDFAAWTVPFLEYPLRTLRESW